MIDLSAARLPPFRHQVEGTELIVSNPFFFNASSMGTGKSKIAIDAAQVLFQQGVINRVLIIAPASVRGVWADKELGELQKHLWLNIGHTITEFHSKTRSWKFGEGERLDWMVTNYEFLRSKSRIEQCKPFCTQKTLMILDESTAIRTWDSAQTKNCKLLRYQCGRVLLLNGTPLANSPLDMFSQGNMMHYSILDCKYITHFKTHYAELEAVKGAGGKALKTQWGSSIEKIVGWKNLPELQARFKPYIFRREKSECIDLPESLAPVTLQVTLSDQEWDAYRAMRDDMIINFENGLSATSYQAGVKFMRMSQILSGFVGGIEDDRDFDLGDTDRNVGLFDSSTGESNISSLRNQQIDSALHQTENEKLIHDFFNIGSCNVDPSSFVDVDDKSSARQTNKTDKQIRIIGSSKLDFIKDFYARKRVEDPNLKILVWVRFVPELHRMMAAIENVQTGFICGGQKPKERQDMLRMLHPETAPDGAVFFGGTYGTGSLGLNFTACATVVNLSYDSSLYKYLQSAARVDRPGQKHVVSNFDVVAVGPKGQRTYDHILVKARREREDLATWTQSAWVKALKDE